MQVLEEIIQKKRTELVLTELKTKEKVILQPKRDKKVTDFADSELYLCVQKLEEKFIAMYVYGKGTSIKSLIANATEGQTFNFSKISPKDLYGDATTAMNAILNDKPRKVEVHKGRIFRNFYSYTDERKAAAYEGMRDFHQAYNR